MQRPGNSDLVDIGGEVRYETERGILFFDGSQTLWLPKSQCEWDETSGTMTMPEWMATDKGLI